MSFIMLPKHALLMAAILSISTPAALALDSANAAIIKPAGLELKIKPEQLARIKTIGADLDLQIKNAFKGEEVLQNEMQAELEKIVKITDETAKLAAITAYQNKYKSRYQAVLAKGKINLADVAAQFNASVPEVEFVLTPNMTIKGILKKVTAEKFSAPPPTTTATIASNNSQNTTVKELVSQDYSISKNFGCGQGPGNEIAVSGGYMTNISNTVASRLEGCENEGAYLYTIYVPPSGSVNVKATYTLTGSVSAVAIGGAAHSHTGAQVKIIPETLAYRGLSESDKVFMYCSTIATFFWASAEECEVPAGFIDQSYQELAGSHYQFIASTWTKQGAAMGRASGESRIKKLRVTVTTRRPRT